MKTKDSLMALSIVLLFFSSCRKETTPSGNTLKDFFSGTRVQSQTFTITAGSWQNITGAKNTIIQFRPGSLITASGSPVTGSVQIELKEIYSKGDMILSNATTTSNGMLLQSGGEIYLKARQNGQELRINPAQPLIVEFPTTAPVAGMQLFTGAFIQNEDLASDSVLNWDTAGAVANIRQDTMSSVLFYGFAVDSFGWTNCDRFYFLTGGTDPMIQVPEGFDNSNTNVNMIFDDENTVTYADQFENQVFSFHSGEHTPIGINVTIVAIAKKGEQYYYAIEHKVTAAGATFNLTMTAASHDAIKAAVSAL